MSLSDEFKLIDGIKQTLGRPSSRVLLGIGDDAAVLKPPRGNLVVTVDTMIEGVHFDLGYMTPFELGYKALAVNLSDIAAMGAEPLYAVVSIGLKQEMNDYFVTELYQGISSLARKYGVDIVGGNTVQSPNTLLVDITLLGQCKDRAITRAGAKPGNLIAVTGDLGSSAAGLHCLKQLGRPAVESMPDLLTAHLKPEPQLKPSRALRKVGGVTALIDISDGLAREVHHLCERSGVGAFIDEKLLPAGEGLKRAAELAGGDPRAWVLYGGEDYQLLFTFPPRKQALLERALKRLKSRMTVVGKVLPKDEGIRIESLSGGTGPLLPRGWNHFARRARPRR
jgi:thiamine-monophosphate kinase